MTRIREDEMSVGARGTGRLLFAAGMIGMGALSLIFGSYALQWQPVPAAFPSWGAYVSGAILVAGGLGLLVSRAAMGAAALLAVFLGLWLFGLHAPGAVANSLKGADWKALSGIWLAFAEVLAMVAGAWTLMALADQDYNEASAPFLTDRKGLTIAQILFGVACLVFGASHFAFADFTATMIPEWIPQRLPLAYITGAGHVLTGLALISGVAARLAAILEALMMSLFVLLVHVPMLLAGPAPDVIQLDWTLLFVAMSMAGSAWAIAGALGRKTAEPA